MEGLLSPAALMVAVGIFFLRIGDMSLDTIRVLFVVRGKKLLVWILGFVQSIIYVVAISSVLSNLDNPVNVVAYAAGFSTGNVLGMLIEERLAIGNIQLNIVSSARGAAVCEALRAGGYAVTEIPARGRNGAVTLLHVGSRRRDVDSIETIVFEVDPEAFITAEDVRSVRRGFWHA